MNTTNLMVLGPILAFKGQYKGNWQTSALLVFRDVSYDFKITLKVNNKPVQHPFAVLLKKFHQYQIWCLDWSVNQTEHARKISYSINNGVSHHYFIPGESNHIHLAYGSCFGTHQKKLIPNKDKMWDILQQNHIIHPYHLMLRGGDQIYADNVWKKAPLLQAWKKLPNAKRLKTAFSSKMKQEIEWFYFYFYCRRWSRTLPAKIMRQIPSLMMWDDHDIFDGWGSLPKEHDCPVHSGIYSVAREFFRIFQLQTTEDELKESPFLDTPGFTYGHTIGKTAILALDLRSERKTDQILSNESWESIEAWIDKHLTNSKTSKGLKHLIILSSVPMTYVNTRIVEKALSFFPGRVGLEDDLRDQWQSYSHQQERIKVLEKLFDFSEEAGCRVTILSGDVHVACLGHFTHDSNEISQLVSSAMFNIPPPKLDFSPMLLWLS